MLFEKARSVPMDSLRKRYVIRFSTQVASGLILLISQSLMLRGLGPKSYGDYNFTTQFFTQVTAFLDFGVTTAFFTKLSQRPDDTGLIRFYYFYWVVLSVAQVIFLLVAFGTPWSGFLWPEQSFAWVALGLLWALSNAFWQGTSRIADAFALTVRSEKIKLGMRAIALSLMVPFFFAHSLNLKVVFGSQILCFLILTVVLYRISRPSPGILWGKGGVAVKRYGKEMLQYCAPLVVYGTTSLAASLFDNWMLQRFGGSVEQGYFGLCTQLSLVCLLFCSAMLPLIHREFSVACSSGRGVAELYLKCVPPIVSGATCFAIFIAVNSAEIVIWFSGKGYLPAAPVVTLGILFTIPQCYSQLTSTLFYANGQTRVFQQLGLVSCFLGMPLTFLFVGPVSLFGSDLGALGLTIKMLVVAIVIMGIQMRRTALQIGQSAWGEARRYAVMFTWLFLAAETAHFSAKIVLRSSSFGVFLSFAIFAGLVGVIAVLLPEKVGLPRNWTAFFRNNLLSPGQNPA